MGDLKLPCPECFGVTLPLPAKGHALMCWCICGLGVNLYRGDHVHMSYKQKGFTHNVTYSLEAMEDMSKHRVKYDECAPTHTVEGVPTWVI